MALYKAQYGIGGICPLLLEEAEMALYEAQYGIGGITEITGPVPSLV